MVYAIKKSYLYKLKAITKGKTTGYYISQAVNIDNFDHYLLAKIKSKFINHIFNK